MESCNNTSISCRYRLNPGKRDKKMYICINSSSQSMKRGKMLQVCRLGPIRTVPEPEPATATATNAAKKPQHRMPGLRLRVLVIYYMRRAPRPPRLDSVFFFKDEMRSSLSLRKRDILSSKEAKLGLRPPRSRLPKPPLPLPSLGRS